MHGNKSFTLWLHNSHFLLIYYTFFLTFLSFKRVATIKDSVFNRLCFCNQYKTYLRFVASTKTKTEKSIR